MKAPHNVAIVLAAGQGRRMNSKIQKQYLLLDEKPVLFYSLEAFQASAHIQEIILVVGKGEEAYCQEQIVNKFGFDKVSRIVAGGKERYHSVYNGLMSLGFCDYVFIHDGARPFVNEEIILRAVEAVENCKACVIGMPVKDTIKIADEDGYAAATPNRDYVWMVQTPQVFEFSIIKEAYIRLLESETAYVTDDAMVVETMTDLKVKLVPGSYENIKITTPEDLEIAEVFIRRKKF